MLPESSSPRKLSRPRIHLTINGKRFRVVELHDRRGPGVHIDASQRVVWMRPSVFRPLGIAAEKLAANMAEAQ